MHRTLAALACLFVLASLGRGDPPDSVPIPGSLPIPRPPHNVKEWGPLDYDDTPGAMPGGLVFGRVNGQRFVRIGGGLFPMKIWASEPGPDGRVRTQMILPSAAQSSLVPLVLQHQAVLPRPTADRACILVQIPNPNGLLYVDDHLTNSRGTSRQLESPPLTAGQSHVFRLRAGYMVGDNFLIEQKTVSVRAGENATVTFDGKQAVSVYLPEKKP